MFVYQPVKFGWRGDALYVEVHEDLLFSVADRPASSKGQRQGDAREIRDSISFSSNHEISTDRYGPGALFLRLPESCIGISGCAQSCSLHRLSAMGAATILGSSEVDGKVSACRAQRIVVAPIEPLRRDKRFSKRR